MTTEPRPNDPNPPGGQASFDFGPERPRIRPMHDDERRSVTDVLGRAFFDDPVAHFLFPNEAKRVSQFSRLAGLEIDSFGEDGIVLTLAGASGAAIWRAPRPRSPGRFASFMIGMRMIRLMRTRVSRIARIGDLMMRHAPREPHYYLATLGTDPNAQGKGIGSALMAPILSRCDREGLPAYLESSKESNLAFYRRHGFEVTSEMQVPQGPMLWGMQRPPRPNESRSEC